MIARLGGVMTAWEALEGRAHLAILPAWADVVYEKLSLALIRHSI